MSEARDLAGYRYGKLVALRMDGREKPQRNKIGRLKWLWQCDCGNTLSARASAVTSGNTKSCGCNHNGNPTHGATVGKLKTGKTLKSYSIWAGMHKRCGNPKEPSYLNYGGRGINVCERWASYENFVFDMGEPPVGMSIDRKNNSKGYSPDNCRWATVKEQQNNRTNNVTVVDCGEKYTLAQFAEKYGFKYKWIHAWRQRGVDVVGLAHAIRAVALNLYFKEIFV